MKNLFLAAPLLIAGFAAQGQIQVVVTDNDLGSGTYSWTSNNEYLLDGMVYLESGGVLNIEAGTVIKGMAAPGNPNDAASALVITKGAKIYANGDRFNPVIFTSELDDLNDQNDLTADDKGLWGGLLILGNGIVGNGTGTGQIEGIPTTEPRGAYGGNNNADNSGSLTYVSIRHGGAVIGANNEINGLTLGGVGSGTTMDHIEVFANVDDGIEFFGGAVNIKNAVVAFCGDDSYDFDEGWSGKGQFLFSIQGSTDGDCGIEGDGANPASANPVSNPTLFNLTFIGAGASGATAANSHAFLLRDNTNALIANSVFADFANKGVQVQDVGGSSSDSYSRIGQTPGINLYNNLFYQIGSNTSLDGSATGIIKATSGADDASASLLATNMNNNANQVANPGMVSIGRNTNNQLDPRSTGSAATTNLAPYPADAFFTHVNFKGAFDPGNSDWMNDWTALDKMNYLAMAVGVEENHQAKNNLSAYPNPASGIINLSFEVKEPEFHQVIIYDLSGRELLEVFSGEFESGQKNLSVNLSELPAGIYVCRVKSSTSTASVRIIKK